MRPGRGSRSAGPGAGEETDTGPKTTTARSRCFNVIVGEETLVAEGQVTLPDDSARPGHTIASQGIQPCTRTPPSRVTHREHETLLHTRRSSESFQNETFHQTRRSSMLAIHAGKAEYVSVLDLTNRFVVVWSLW